MTKASNLLSSKEIYDFFYFDDKSPSGLRWRIKPSKRINVGDVAGSITVDGYWRVTLNKICYFAHRIVYQYHHGFIDNNQDVDHIDGDKLNNDINNLRLISHAENQRNRKIRKSNISGVHGVFLDFKNNSWVATWSGIDGKRYKKRFGVAKHGANALNMAIECRLNSINELNRNNANYSERHIMKGTQSWQA